MIGRYIIRDEHIRRNAAAFVATLPIDPAKPVELIAQPLTKKRTNPQLRTLWKWHGEVAAWLTMNTAVKWTKDEVHERLFLAKFMPMVDAVLPDGTTVPKPQRTTGAPREVISEAMDAYMAWCYDHGIEITVPEPAL